MPLHSSASGTNLHESLREKAPVRAASTANVTLTAPGASLDGVNLNVSDRILLKNQLVDTENGIYTWSGQFASLVRSLDALSAADFVYGFKVYVREGTTNSATHWVFSQSTAVTLGTTSLTFTGIGTGSGAQGIQGIQGPPGQLAVTISGSVPYVCIQDQKPSNTGGGTFTQGAWQTRTLNTFNTNDLSLATLDTATNRFTLPAGVWRTKIRAPARAVGNHQARLRSITGSGTTLVGASARTDAAGQAQSDSWIAGRFSIRSSTVFEIQHQCASTVATTGFGIPNAFGEIELYTVAEFWLEAGPPPFFGSTQSLVPLPHLYIRRQRYMLLKHAASVFNLVGGDAQPGPESRMILP